MEQRRLELELATTTAGANSGPQQLNGGGAGAGSNNQLQIVEEANNKNNGEITRKLSGKKKSKKVNYIFKKCLMIQSVIIQLGLHKQLCSVKRGKPNLGKMKLLLLPYECNS